VGHTHPFFYPYYIQYCMVMNFFSFVAEVDKMSKKIKEVQKSNVCVVSEDYLDDVQKGGGLVKIMAHKISSWGDIVSVQHCQLRTLCVHVRESARVIID